jgi:hypothetical protein
MVDKERRARSKRHEMCQLGELLRPMTQLFRFLIALAVPYKCSMLRLVRCSGATFAANMIARRSTRRGIVEGTAGNDNGRGRAT